MQTQLVYAIGLLFLGILASTWGRDDATTFIGWGLVLGCLAWLAILRAWVRYRQECEEG